MREGKINELNMKHVDSHVNVYMYMPYFMSYDHYSSLKTFFHHKNDVKT